jgi:hypothetical protein
VLAIGRLNAVAIEMPRRTAIKPTTKFQRIGSSSSTAPTNEALGNAGRPWRLAFVSHSLASVEAMPLKASP